MWSRTRTIIFKIAIIQFTNRIERTETAGLNKQKQQRIKRINSTIETKTYSHSLNVARSERNVCVRSSNSSTNNNNNNVNSQYQQQQREPQWKYENFSEWLTLTRAYDNQHNAIIISTLGCVCSVKCDRSVCLSAFDFSHFRTFSEFIFDSIFVINSNNNCSLSL